MSVTQKQQCLAVLKEATGDQPVQWSGIIDSGRGMTIALNANAAKFSIRWRAPTYVDSSRQGLAPSFFCESQGFSTEDVWQIARLEPGETVELDGSSGVEVTREV